MNFVDNVLLSRFYQISKLSTLQLEAFLPKIKSHELQTIISNQISNYDVISRECCTIAKSHNITLPDHTFFKRCKQIIADSFDEVKDITIPVIIATITATSLNTLIEIYNVESANTETINIGKHLQIMQDNNLQILRQIKL